MEKKRSEGVITGIIKVSCYILFISLYIHMPFLMGAAIGPGGGGHTLADHLKRLCVNTTIFSSFLIFISAIGMLVLRNWARRLIVVLLPLNSVLYAYLFLRHVIGTMFSTLVVLTPLLFLRYLTRPEVKEKFKKTTIERGMIYLGFFNIFWSLYMFILFIDNRYQVSSVLLGIFCLISGVGIRDRKEWIRKIFLFGSIPLVILTLFNVILFGNKEAPYPIFSDVVGDLLPVIVVFLLFPLALNFYILTRPKVKEQFK